MRRSTNERVRRHERAMDSRSPSTPENLVFISLPDGAEWPLHPDSRGRQAMGASAVGASAEVDCKGEAQTPGRLTDESQFDSTKRVLFDEDLLQLCMSALHLPEVLCAAATCMTWSRVATRESLWRSLYLRDSLTRGVAHVPMVSPPSGWRAAYRDFGFAQLIKEVPCDSSTFDEDCDHLCKVVLLGPSFCGSTFLNLTCHRPSEFYPRNAMWRGDVECGVCFARFLGKVYKMLIWDLPATEREAYDRLIRDADCVCVCFNIHQATTFERLVDPSYWEYRDPSTYRSLVLVGLDVCSSNQPRRQEREVSYERARAFAASMSTILSSRSDSDGDIHIPYVECDPSSGNGIGQALGVMLSRRDGLPFLSEWRNRMMNSRDAPTLWQSIPSTSTVASVGLNVVGGMTSLLPLPSTSTVASVGLNVVEVASAGLIVVGGLMSLLPLPSVVRDSLLPLSWRD